MIRTRLLSTIDVSTPLAESQPGEGIAFKTMRIQASEKSGEDIKRSQDDRSGDGTVKGFAKFSIYLAKSPDRRRVDVKTWRLSSKA
jgi:hypothetical protein